MTRTITISDETYQALKGDVENSGKKYRLTEETKDGLFRIEALKDFGNVKKGDKGGWVGSEKNLSQEYDAWVFGNARVSGDARVSGNVRVFGDARVSGDAWVSGGNIQGGS